MCLFMCKMGRCFGLTTPLKRKGEIGGTAGVLDRRAVFGNASVITGQNVQVEPCAPRRFFFLVVVRWGHGHLETYFPVLAKQECAFRCTGGWHRVHHEAASQAVGLPHFLGRFRVHICVFSSCWKPLNAVINIRCVIFLAL